MLHGQYVLLAGLRIPWGAAAALTLVGAAELWLGAAFRSVLPAGVCGAVCYALAGWWSSLEPGRRLIIGNLAGSLWIYGIAAVTLVLLVWCRRYRQQPPAQPAVGSR